MTTFLSIISFITTNYQVIITGILSILVGIIGIALVIPGDQPEKALQAIVDFLEKFSVKPK